MQLLGDRTGSARRRATALVLLCLVVHALIINATHHHRSDSPPFNRLISGAGNSSQTPNSLPGSDCPSCCLQRVCVSTATPSPLVVELLLATLSSQPLRALLRSSRCCLVFSSRAPPRT